MALCECGCGRETSFDRKGKPKRFILGHNNRGNLRNTSVLNSYGYSLSYRPNHARNITEVYVFTHVLIAEKALGKPLPPGAKVHHVNGKRGDNSRGNHVICQDQAFHMLLHRRMRALKACGNAGWERCTHCKKYDAPEKLSKTGKCYYHKSCRKHYTREYRERKNKEVL